MVWGKDKNYQMNPPSQKATFATAALSKSCSDKPIRSSRRNTYFAYVGFK